jgi:magnesium transporter
MVANVPVFKVGERRDVIWKKLHEEITTFETINYLYFINEADVLVGVLSIKDFFSKTVEVLSLHDIEQKIYSVRSSSDQERAALLALKHNIKAVPVVDARGVFLGVVTSETILHILHREQIEDILHHSGTARFDDPVESLRSGTALLHFKKRIPWLIIGLAGGSGAAFIPMIVYMADAVGSQSQSIFIRSLALPNAPSMRMYIVREMRVVAAIALVLSLLVFSISFLVLGSFVVSSILGLSILAGVSVSVAIALMLPYTFKKLHFDPALASGPFATVLCDTTSLLIYFSIATVIL